MHPAIQSLFEYAAKKVTHQDIEDFCPGDPGYLDYVREMTSIRDSLQIPRESNFDIRETISLVGWARPSDYRWPRNFMRFRRFTTAIAIGLVTVHGLARSGGAGRPC